MMMDYKPRRRNSCGVCLRYCLAVANILFTLLGAGVVALFIYLYLTRLFFVSTVLITNLVVAGTFLIIVGGCLLVIAAIVGFAAVASNRPSVTAAHFSLLILVFVAVLAGIMCALVFRIFLNEGVMEDMQKTLWTEYGVNVNTSARNRQITKDWDKAQSLWECCAVEEQGWGDYQKSTWYRLQSGTPHGGDNARPYVPRSCCKITDDSGYISDEDLRRCQTSTDGPPRRRQGSQYTGRINKSLHYRGCYEAAKDHLLYTDWHYIRTDFSWFDIVIVVGTIVSVIVLIGIVVSVTYYVLREKEIKQQTAMMMDDSNAQTMVSLTQPSWPSADRSVPKAGYSVWT